MSSLGQHEMELVRNYSTGAEEWFCPVCDRRVLMQWAPVYKRIVLEVGDKAAIHSGSKRNMQLQSARTTKADEQIISDELRILIEDALKDVDFGD